jgi:cytidine deaminase
MRNEHRMVIIELSSLRAKRRAIQRRAMDCRVAFRLLAMATVPCPSLLPAHKVAFMTDQELIEAARAAALKAYAPYSRFHVGCAVESVDGEVVTGANMENACYRLGICAEQSALTAASQAFGLGKVARIAVAGGGVEGAALTGEVTCTPCGGCRQAILEAAHLSGRDVEILCANGEGGRVERHSISDLIPHSFGPANLADAG